MTEWFSVIAVFWALWAFDGARLLGWRAFAFTGRLWRRRGRMGFSRLSLPSWWPLAGRVVGEDVPLSFSPEGVCARAVGGVGRPAEQPAGAARAWRWEEIRQVGVAKGWLFVNHTRFCPATWHITGTELLAVAQAAPAEREARLRTIMSRWFRPAHLRRRARVLAGRTAWAAALNLATLVVLLAVSVYVAGEVGTRLGAKWNERIGALLPGVLLGALLLHVAAVALAWRAVRGLKAVRLEKRASNLFSALMLPPQGLRLRALAGEGFFPAQHPLAQALAWVGERSRRAAAFAAIADLRWPIHGAEDGPLAQAISGWFRANLATHVDKMLRQEGIEVEPLLAAPKRDTRLSCCYCPRCRAQFVTAGKCCPQGVRLEPLN